MNPDRRKLLTGLALTPLASLAPAPARAQAGWPERPIHIVPPSPPGVGSDVFARVYADSLSKALKVPVVVENKTGAANTIAAGFVAKSPADGYTVLFSPSNPFTIAPHLMANVPFAATDLLAITQTLRGGSFIFCNNGVPAKNLAELVALAKSKPGSLTFASYGPGSTAHIGFELFQDAAGIQMLHVPYKRSIIPDVIGGQVQLGMEPPISVLPMIRSGHLRALAYTGEKRSRALPDVPTLAETWPGTTVISWLGFWVPAGTPAPLVERLHREISKVSFSKEMERYRDEAGVEPVSTSPAETLAILQRESAAMEKIIKAKGIRME